MLVHLSLSCMEQLRFFPRALTTANIKEIFNFGSTLSDMATVQGLGFRASDLRDGAQFGCVCVWGVLLSLHLIGRMSHVLRLRFFPCAIVFV